MKMPAEEIKKKVDWAIDILGLEEYRYRKPKNLSGGQRQRVALGRGVYISGLPYSFENSRVLYRSVLWSASAEEELNLWYSTNYNVEVHAYVKNGKYCVVNNTYEPQDTTVYRGDGSSFDLHMGANEIKWYEI